MTTFGLDSGGTLGAGHHGTDRSAVRLTTPPNSSLIARHRSCRGRLLALLQFEVLVARPLVAIGAVPQQPAGAHLFYLILELLQQIVEVVFRPGLLEFVERLVDLVEMP